MKEWMARISKFYEHWFQYEIRVSKASAKNDELVLYSDCGTEDR